MNPLHKERIAKVLIEAIKQGQIVGTSEEIFPGIPKLPLENPERLPFGKQAKSVIEGVEYTYSIGGNMNHVYDDTSDSEVWIGGWSVIETSGPAAPAIFNRKSSIENRIHAYRRHHPRRR